ncbi:MAG: alkaline phosphatase family protein, partial [Nanoarchaeota archaeon]
ETHRRHPGKNQYQNAIRDYYVYLDKKIGEIKKMLDDDTYLIIASDHGFDKMEGRINLNDWLIKEGYLVLKEKPASPQKIDFSKVDWAKTKAYSIGAYFGRIYFNRKARDAVNGILEEEEVPLLQQELMAKLSKLQDDLGEELDNQFYFPQEVYTGPYLKESPDLYIYFDNLRWGVNNDVGNEGFYSQETTKGSDDAGHAPVGLFLLHHPSISGRNIEVIDIIDVMPTIYKLYGLEVPADLKGKVLV